MVLLALLAVLCGAVRTAPVITRSSGFPHLPPLQALAVVDPSVVGALVSEVSSCHHRGRL